MRIPAPSSPPLLQSTTLSATATARGRSASAPPAPEASRCVRGWERRPVLSHQGEGGEEEALNQRHLCPGADYPTDNTARPCSNLPPPSPAAGLRRVRRNLRRRPDGPQRLPGASVRGGDKRLTECGCVTRQVSIESTRPFHLPTRRSLRRCDTRVQRAMPRGLLRACRPSAL